MSEALYDYSESYNRLRYKYKGKFQRLLTERLQNCTAVKCLKMKNGEPLRYILTPVIQDLFVRVTKLLKDTKVDEGTKTYVYEGFYSSVIEGARTTIPETIKLVNGERDPSNISERMVYNNVKLIHSYFDAPFPFTESAILSAWSLLVDGACDNEDLRGEKYRNGQVVVGDSMRVTFEPPQPVQLQEFMDNLYTYFKKPHTTSPIIQAIVIHYYFVYVHPFCDGNGRMSRFLLQQWLIQQAATCKFRYISLSGAVNDNRQQYYRALENSENELNDITYFIEYYLRAMEIQLQRSIELFGANADLSARQLSILKKINHNGVTAAKYAELYTVSIATARKELAELVDLGEFRVVKNKSDAYNYLKAKI